MIIFSTGTNDFDEEELVLRQFESTWHMDHALGKSSAVGAKPS